MLVTKVHMKELRPPTFLNHEPCPHIMEYLGATFFGDQLGFITVEKVYIFKQPI